MRKCIIIPSILVALIIVVLITSVGDNRSYLLENNKTISQVEILSFEREIISEYNKNFERFSPENKQLYYLFVLSQSFNSTIMLSYCGNIGYVIQESNYSDVEIIYLNQSNSGGMFGLPFGKECYLEDIVFYGWHPASDYRYAYISNIDDLITESPRELALYYYRLDYARYLEINASLNKLEEEKRKKLREAFNEIILASQTGNKDAELNATIHYFWLAEDLGISDDSAKKILDDMIDEYQSNVTQGNNTSDIKSNNSLLTPNRFTFLALIYFIIFLPIVFIKSEQWKEKLRENGQIGSIAYVSWILEGGLSVIGLGGTAFWYYLYSNGMTPLHWFLIICSIMLGLYLTINSERSNYKYRYPKS